MLSKINKIATFLILSVSLVSCDQNNSITSFSKLNEKGSIKVNLVNPAKFKTASFNTKYLDPTDVFYGTLSVTGSGIGSPITNSVTPNPIRLQSGNKANADILIDAIPTGNNRIIKVLGLDRSSTSLGAHVQVMGLANVLAGKTVSTEVSWRTTPSAKVIEQLISLSSTYTSTLNSTTLQNAVDTIITNNTAGNTADDIHPSLVNSTALGTYINSNGGNLPPLTNTTEINTYRTPAQTITGKVNNITYSVVGLNQVAVKHIPTTKIVCNDPASSVFTVTDKDGNFTLTGVTPGTGYTVKAMPDYYDPVTLSNINSGATGLVFNPTAQHYLQHSINTSFGVRRFTSSRALKVQVITPTASINYSAENRAAVTSAINAWQKFAGDKLTFDVLPDITASDPSLAAKKTASDIYIQWAQTLSGSNIGYALSLPDVNSTAVPPPGVGIPLNFATMPYNSTDYRVAIVLATQDSTGAKLLEPNLTSVAQHELGHGFGLAIEAAGTSNTHPQTNIDDLMYPSINFGAPLNLNIGVRDLNTLRFLYDLPANITRN